MKRYKLKKWYPSLPKDVKEGTVVEKNGYLTNKGDILSTDEVENNPEFWEPVKDYEILSFINPKNNSKALRGKCGGDPDKGFPYEVRFDCQWEMYRPTEEELIEKNWNIHSVKRLSDGEVFTIGDRVKSTTHNDEGKIYEFKIEGSTIRASVSKLYYNIKYIQHVKQPLFTTEDGVDIYI